MTGKVLIILSHHDDELFLGLHLEHLYRRQLNVVVVFLTESSIGEDGIYRRYYESKRYFQKRLKGKLLIHSVGDDRAIRPGDLWQRIPEVSQHLAQLLPDLSDCRKILSPAWEGGHPDHDAAHLIARVMINRLLKGGIQCEHWEFPLYNSKKFPRLFFSVWQWARTDQTIIAFEEGSYLRRLLHVLDFTFYPSQWRTWLGLWPLVLWHRMCNFRVPLGQVPRNRNYLVPPHPGLALSERRFKVKWSMLEEKVKEVWNQLQDSASRA